MRLRIPGFFKTSDDDKVRMDRRAFLRGMTVTAAGLLVPKATVFDQGRIVRTPDAFEQLLAEQSAAVRQVGAMWAELASVQRQMSAAIAWAAYGRPSA